jgi:Integrin beta chain VWA domain
MIERIPDALRRRAQERIQEREGVENVRVGRTEVDEVPSTGRQIYRIDAFEAGDPNGPRYEIVLDEEGEEVDLAALAEREDKEFFAMAPFEPGPPRPVAALAASITIEPTEDILVLNPGDTSQEIVTVKVPRNMGVSKVDVYFLADTTSSMIAIIPAVKAGANHFLSVLNGLGLDMAFGVGNYKDFSTIPPSDPFPFQHQLAPSTTVADVTNAINTWSASGGGDGTEGQLFALDQLAEAPGGTIGWRSDAKRIIVWFGDAPGHDPVCAAISGLPFDVTEASVTTKLVNQDISVVAISTPTGSPLDALDGDPTDFAHAYVGACGFPEGRPARPPASPLLQAAHTS